MPVSIPENKYEKALKKRAVSDYIKENDRAPSKEQVFELMDQYRVLYPNLNDVGFSGIDTEKIGVKLPSSSAVENKNRDAFYDDMVVISEKSEELIELLEDSFRGFKATSTRCNKILNQVNLKLNNLLLLSGRTDAFVYGIEETFESQENIDLENSTVSVEVGYVTIGRVGYTKASLEEMNLFVSSFGTNPVQFTKSVSELNSLKSQDGTIWEYHVYTSNPMGKVICAIDMESEEEDGIYVGDVRLTGNPTNSNSIMTATLFYSVDGQTFSVVKPVEKEFEAGENQFSVGVDGVKALRLLLTKKAADDIPDDPNADCLYIFSLDSLEIFVDRYDEPKLGASFLYAGPYNVLDEMGNPVYFTSATIAGDVCCALPDGTSVSFYLSKDNSTWFPINWKGESIDIIRFEKTNPAGSFDYIDDSNSANALTDTPPSIAEIDYGEEAFCNLYITESFYDRFIQQTCVVKRNLPMAGTDLYGISSGWFIDTETMQYRCSFIVESIEGRYINLGNTSAYLDGRLVSGTIHIAQGTHDFSTNYTNWYEVDSGILTAIDLEEKDPVYPFNHKFIVEGYEYASSFDGEQLYTGFDEYFGASLKYVTPEEFRGSENVGNLYIYTIENYDDELYFKVKIDPSDSSWTSEQIEISYLLRSNSSNTLYVKAALRTNDPSQTPHLNSFKVRVI